MNPQSYKTYDLAGNEVTGSASFGRTTNVAALDRRIKRLNGFDDKTPEGKQLFIARQAYDAVIRASLAQECAWSYREDPFRVGACALALLRDESGAYTLAAAGANVKTAKSGKRIDDHGEFATVHGIHERMKDRFGEIAKNMDIHVALMALVADYQADQETGKAGRTLPPCRWCRNELPSTGIVNEQTTFLSSTADLDTFEISTLKQLRGFYDDENAPDATIDHVALDSGLEIPSAIPHNRLMLPSGSAGKQLERELIARRAIFALST